MKPDRQQQAEIWEVLKTSPLMQKWPQFRTQVLPDAEVAQYRSGDFVFRRGDAPHHLFIVVAGTVLVRLQEGGEAWFEQEVQPGQIFGQQALWDEAYRTTARVAMRGMPATLLLIEASALRVALERMPDLREELLHDGRAGRLRRVPLFRDLNDDQVRWLAQLVEERNLRPGAVLELRQGPGIWIIDRGQLAVTGPLNPLPNEWPTWRITAGNFLVAAGNPMEAADPAKAMHFGLSCAADTASAMVDTRLFYLPAIHAHRVIDQFPDVGKLVHQPINIAATLDQAPLFQALTPLRRQHLAQYCGWEFVPEKQNVTTQGLPGHSYVMLREGGALITAFDNYGRERPRSRLEPRAAYGKTSLLKGSPREVTVRAVRGEALRGVPGVAGADIITLDRRDFLHAVAERPDLWSGQPLARQVAATTDVEPEYAWMQEGEEVQWSSRPHILWLIAPLALIVLSLLTLVVVVLLLPPELMLIGDIALVILGGFLVLVGIFAVINYYDDYYVLTNRRVTRRDRQLVLFEARAEAPVEMIQDVTINSDFWGRIFDFGDVTIRTASKGGAIQLEKTPRPYEVKELLESTRTEAQADERGRQKEELRRGLIKDLHLALPVPQRQRALGDAPPPRTGPAPDWFHRLFERQPKKQRVPTPPSTQAWLAQHSSRLPDSWRKALVGTTPAPTPPKELPGMVLWRKHWVNAIARVGPPLLAFMAVLFGGLLLLTGALGSLALTGPGFVFGWLVLLGGVGFWLWWEFVDYRNDVYIVTDDRVVDIEMKPWGLDAKRREGGLERVQNVVAQQNGVWAKIFGYGDVVISTAASDEGFTFIMVPKPQLVQAVIFQKLNQFRVRDEQRRAAQRQQELIEALSVYHQLRGGTGADSFR